MNAAENEPHEGLVENITEEEFKTLQEEGVLDNTFTYDEYKDLYLAHDDQFICPNGRKVVFITYKNKKNTSGHIQSYKIYECEDCSDCPPKAQCTKAKGNRQVHLNMIYEEMEAKAKTALECEENAEIYSRRKTEIENVFGHIKGNRSFRRFSLRGLKKIHVEFGIVALAHNFLKVAGICQLLSRGDPKNTKSGEGKQTVFLRLIYFKGFLETSCRRKISLG
ncbi:transposase [Siminovitchia sp. FSL W7-1587]|uniref:transposase n=1 Tax=Siminovitchia sp. FSL W7-1587 TaxID=2954699 RepID=UPI0030D22952